MFGCFALEFMSRESIAPRSRFVELFRIFSSRSIDTGAEVTLRCVNISRPWLFRFVDVPKAFIVNAAARDVLHSSLSIRATGVELLADFFAFDDETVSPEISIPRFFRLPSLEYRAEERRHRKCCPAKIGKMRCHQGS